MICESSGKVEFVGCLGTDVPSEVKRQRTCGSLGQNLKTLTVKQQAKDLFNFTVLFSNFSPRNQKHLLRWSPTAQKLSLNCVTFYANDSSGGLDSSASMSWWMKLFFQAKCFKKKVFQ